MSNQTPPHCDVWATTERMQEIAAKRRSGTTPQSARGRFTPPRARALGRPAIDSPLQRSRDLSVHADYLGGAFA